MVFKWSKQQHRDAATGLRAKADQYKAAGNKKAVKALMTQVEGHERLADLTVDESDLGE